MPLLHAQAPASLAQRVLVVYNSKVQSSVSVATYYSAKRGIPAANLCPIAPPSTTTLAWADYDATVRSVVKTCLNAVGANNILYIVLTYQTPYTVTAPDNNLYALDQYLADIWDANSPAGQYGFSGSGQPYYANAQSQANIYPSWQSFATYRSQANAIRIYSVWRLDGATQAIAQGLVDKALAAESAGLSGQGCFDRRGGDISQIQDTDVGSGEWDLHRAAGFTAQAGFTVTEDSNAAEFGTAPAPLRCDGAALYSGWYSLNNYNDAFSWNTGAIGFHLDSASAVDPRGGANWSANALIRGITVTSGSVAEPFLEGLPHPDVVYLSLLQGANVGDAFLRAEYALKWMLLNIGDPLYRPFPGGFPAVGVPSLSPGLTSLMFGNQPLGSLSATQTVAFTNTWTSPVAITSILVTGNNASDFRQTNTCGASVAPGGACTISVTFTPAALGARSATLAINDAGGQHSVALTGTGTPAVPMPLVSLSLASLTFATQSVGAGSAAQSVTLSNSGSAALSITSIVVTGTGSSNFSQTNTCGASVAPGGACTISVVFTPGAAGTRSASITITDNAAGSPHSVSLTGAVTPPGAPAFYLNGNNTDVPTLHNGAAVSPAYIPSGLSGQVVVRGSGSVAYAPLPNGDGLSFAQSGDQNTNTGFLAFSGSAVSSLFNISQGDLSFFVKSNFSFASRLSSLPSEYIFSVDDSSQRLFGFVIGASASRLVFNVFVGGAGNYYFVPAGQEDAVFGNGVVAKFRLTWNGSHAVLYLNDTSVLAFDYTSLKPSWSPSASFTVGASSLNDFGGGYYAAADSVADFQVGGGASGPLFGEIGVYRPTAAGGNAPMAFYLDSNGNNAWDATDQVRIFGMTGVAGTTLNDVPVAGDWDGTGVIRFGVFHCPAPGQPGTCTWFIDLNNNGAWDGVSQGDAAWGFGLPGDMPVVGDWTGDGQSKIGVFRCPAVGQPGECAWILDLGNKHTYDPATVGTYLFGLPGDQPAAGTWKAAPSTADQVGVYRPATGQWIVDSAGNTGGSALEVYSPSDAVFTFNAPGGFMAGDIAVVGNWNGNGQKRIGIFRSSNGQWYLDTNGDGVYDSGDQAFAFGLTPGANPGGVPDQPIVGFWTLP